MELATVMGNLAIELQAQADPAAVLQTIVDAAIDISPGISWAGISLVKGKKVIPESPTDEVARTLDRLQGELGEGPAIDSLTSEHCVVIADLTAEPRWPRFVEAATSMGVRCLMSFRLFVKDGTLGALTLYGPDISMFDDDSVLFCELLAQHAAVAMAGSQAEEQMQRALSTRDVIGQAKGMLMQRDNLTSLQAFALLARASQETNVKLVDVARLLVSDFEAKLPPNN
jgi:GAF domain-containing protein